MHTEIKADFLDILDHAPDEVAGLRLAFVEGRISGRHYEGPCACIKGTIAKLQGCHFYEIYGIKAHHLSPVEQFFLNIKKSDTPENNGESKLAVEWIDEWLAKNTEKTT